jgi:Glycosyltransferase family 87
MAQPERPWSRALVTLYVALALGWVALARWVVPPLLIVERPGRALAAVKWLIQRRPALFLPRDILSTWRDFAGAVLIALVLHLTIILILRRYDPRVAEGRSSTEVGAGRRASLVLLIVSLAFLAVTVLSGPQHDYYFYLQMWYEVRHGHDPWFIVQGIHGTGPLNAYGPLFNVLAILSWVNPLAPKLLFAYGYVLFAISQIKGFAASRPPSGLRVIVLAALFWNPFPWVEVAVRGHFDILVGLFCLWAIRAWVRRRDALSGTCLALGVLLKYLPVVLLPFLAFDRGRLRPRFLMVAVLSIAIGLGLSLDLWGLSTLLPLRFAASRHSTPLSIFGFIRGRYSPLQWFGLGGNYDEWATPILVLALLWIWNWYRVRKPDVEGAAVVAVATTVLLYRTGYPQYQMVPFVLGSSWAVRHWGEIRGRAARIVAIACYFGWLAAFDLYYGFVDEGFRNNVHWDVVREAVGLPSFLFGCAFLAAVARSSTAEDGGVVDRPEGQAGR